MVLTSGYYYVLYPLTNRWPANPEFVDIIFSRKAGHLKKRPELVQELRDFPPEIVVESYRVVDNFSNEDLLKEIWPDFEKVYVMEKDFPKNSQQHYGHFGAKIWRLSK